MKKGQVYEAIVEKTSFPNKGIVTIEDRQIIVKNALEGQKISCSITKLRRDGGQARLLDVVEKAPMEDGTPMCSHFGACGGCAYQTMSYENQLKFKEKQVKELIDNAVSNSSYIFDNKEDDKQVEYNYHGINPSPSYKEYRNKMEFSFGDEVKDGPLALGLHKINSMYDIVSIPGSPVHGTFQARVLEWGAIAFSD